MRKNEFKKLKPGDLIREVSGFGVLLVRDKDGDGSVIALFSGNKRKLTLAEHRAWSVVSRAPRMETNV